MIYGKNFFGQPIKNDQITYDNVRKIATDQGDDYTAGCLLDKFALKMITTNTIDSNIVSNDYNRQQQI